MTLGKATLEGLQSRGLVRRLEAGEVLFSRGDTPDGMYVLLSGRCSASGDGEEEHFIEPGELFGELAPLGGGVRTATVTATEGGDVLRITAEDVRDSDLPREVVWSWLEDVARRGRDIKEQQEGLIEEMATRRAVQRMRMPSVDLIRQIALRLLPEGLEGYIEGGAGDELTLSANEAAWRAVELAPHVLTGVRDRDSSVEVLGRRLPHPLIVAPTGFQRLIHPDGEIACARGARAAGAVFCLSTFATTSAKELAAQLPDLDWWFQLYWFTDRDLNWGLVDNAVAAGAKAIVLTVDLATLGSRERDHHSGFSLRGSMVVPNVAETGRHPTAKLAPVWATLDPGVCWQDLDELVERAGVPVIVKGLVRGDDARRAADSGAAAVVVSNHGGRQLDTAVAAASALPEVVDAVDGRIDVLVDGGIRRGSDIVKALALGAQAVLIGRPPLWGLAAGGADGVQHVIELLANEFDNALALLGATSAGELDRSLLR
jgi:4-hydroxymandelate oxidase